MNSSMISVEELFQMLKQKFWLILIAGLLGLTISVALTFLVVKPTYEATTQLLINQADQSQTDTIYQQTQADLQLMNTYIAVVKSDVILTDVHNSLSLSMSMEEFKRALNVSSQENSKVMDIQVRTNDPIEAVQISNKIAEIFGQKAPQLLDVKNVEVLSAATVLNAFDPVAPNVPLNLLLGLFAGSLLGIGIVVLTVLNDDRFKSEKDIEQYLDIPVIGTIHKISPVQQKKMRQQQSPKRIRTWLKQVDANVKLWRDKG